MPYEKSNHLVNRFAKKHTHLGEIYGTNDYGCVYRSAM